MSLLFWLAELLIVISPLAGVVVDAIRAFAANKRRVEESLGFDWYECDMSPLCRPGTQTTIKLRSGGRSNACLTNIAVPTHSGWSMNSLRPVSRLPAHG